MGVLGAVLAKQHEAGRVVVVDPHSRDDEASEYEGNDQNRRDDTESPGRQPDSGKQRGRIPLCGHSRIPKAHGSVIGRWQPKLNPRTRPG
jgi:hypothetical protein